MREVDRRTAVRIIGGMALMPFVASCDQATSTIPRFFPPEGAPNKETQNLFETGDVISWGGKRFVLIDGAKHEVGDKYLVGSKFGQYGGRIKTPNIFPANLFPTIEPSSEKNHQDDYTSGIKRIKHDGGEVMLWSGGFTTDSGIVYDVLIPETDMFTAARKELSKNGFSPADEYFHTFGIKAIDQMREMQYKLGQYRAADTAKNLQETFQQAEEWVKYILKKNPRVRLNLVGHSLGGLVMLYITTKYPGLVNNLILISSPVKGLDGENIINKGKMKVAKEAIQAKIGEGEHVIGALTALRKDEEYRRGLDEFSKRLVEKGVSITVISSTDDGIVDEDAVRLEAAEHHIFSMGKSSALDVFGLSAHGIPIGHPKTVELIGKKIGRNLAA